MIRQLALLTTTIALATAPLHADPIPVRQTQGTMHGFLQIRSEGGVIVGHGELLQTAHGTRVTSELILRFKDGSVDDETAVFTQEHTLSLISDHHIQKGPYFPKLLDMLVEANGQITTKSIGKDGKEQVETQHLDLPPDISNGIIGPLLLNVSANSAPFKLSMVAPVGKGRLVKLDVTPEGEQTFTVVGIKRKAQVFRLHIDLGGVIGVVAPIVGKQPDDIHVWVIEGNAPESIRVVQQLYGGGPVVSVELAGTTFPHAK
jgi:hypothetical protein